MRNLAGKIWRKLVGYLKMGTSPEKLALTCAIGVVVGILPFWGITTFLCFGIAAAFRINVAILQLVNYAVYPIQLLMVVPFIKTGTYLFGVNPLPYSLDVLMAKFQTNFWVEVQKVGTAVALGIGVWAIASVPIFVGVYTLSHRVFTQWSKRNLSEASDPVKDF